MMNIWENMSLENLVDYNNGELMIEEWKDIPEWEGAYQISSFGRVKSLNRVFVTKGNQSFTVKEKIRKQTFDGDGYLMVYLSVNQLKRMIKPHRFVAKMFIDNPLNRKTVNHKKGIKTDNRYWELEWNTRSENERHSYVVLGKRSNLKGIKNYGAFNVTSKRIRCNTLNVEFDSILDAARKLGLSDGNIGSVLKNKRVATMGLVFSYIK